MRGEGLCSLGSCSPLYNVFMFRLALSPFWLQRENLSFSPAPPSLFSVPPGRGVWPWKHPHTAPALDRHPLQVFIAISNDPSRLPVGNWPWYHSLRTSLSLKSRVRGRPHTSLLRLGLYTGSPIHSP